MMQHFWKDASLLDLTDEQWESLCDGCGRCCLHKLEDADTGELHYTGVACALLDIESCRCTDYAHRTECVSDCLVLRGASPEVFTWLPETCAYRLVAEGRDLPWWHPLVSGSPDSTHQAGVSVRAFAIGESNVEDPDDYEDFLIEL